MQEKNMWYGQFLRAKRISDARELTIKDVAKELGVSVSFASDVEQGRRSPYDEKKTKRLTGFLKFTEEDIALLHDLAAKGNDRPTHTTKGVVVCRDVRDLMRVAFFSKR